MILLENKANATLPLTLRARPSHPTSKHTTALSAHCGQLLSLTCIGRSPAHWHLETAVVSICALDLRSSRHQIGDAHLCLKIVEPE